MDTQTDKLLALAVGHLETTIARAESLSLSPDMVGASVGLVNAAMAIIREVRECALVDIKKLADVEEYIKTLGPEARKEIRVLLDRLDPQPVPIAIDPAPVPVPLPVKK